MLLLLVLLPMFARLADGWGRKKMLLIGTGGTAVLAWPLTNLMHHQDYSLIMLGQMGFATLVAMTASSIPAVMTEMFPKTIRVTAVSISYNISFALLGGTSPIVAVWLLERSHNDLSFSWYISAAAVLSFLCALSLTDRTNAPLP